MNVVVSKECRKPSIHAVRFFHAKRPVYYACLPPGSEARQRLVESLWEFFTDRENMLWQRWQSCAEEPWPVQLVHGPLGNPQLLLGDRQGPAVSFSEGGGKVWAALCGDAFGVGIDVAGFEEFQGAYPVHRAFQRPELEQALRLTGEDLASAAALLWSIKEAVVKALGCAFHLVDPRQISVSPGAEGAAGGNDGYVFAADLSGKARERFPQAENRTLWVRSFPQHNLWLSIAHLPRRSAAHE